MKRFVLSLMAILTLTLVSVIPVIPVSADGGKDERGLNPKDIVLDGGYVSTFIGYDSNGNSIYQADFSAPQFIEDKTTRIDTQWYWDGSKYVSGDNLFTSQVINEFTFVEDKKGRNISWTPSVDVNNFEQEKDKSGIKEGKQKVKDITPKLLPIDPENENYQNNTLEWDYGSGVYRRLRLIEGMCLEYYKIFEPIGGDFDVTASVIKSLDFDYVRQPSAWDADGKPIEIIVNDNHDISLKKDKALDPKVKYPITIDPDISFTTSPSDGLLSNYGGGVTWATVRNAASASDLFDNIDYSNVGVFGYQHPITLNKDIWVQRAYVFFDSSGLNDSVNITSSVLSLRGTSIADDDFGAWTLQIQSGMPTYPHDPLVVQDFNLTNYANNGGQEASGNLIAAYVDIVLNATGISWVNKTGYTKFALRELEHDINNVEPGWVAGVKYNSWQFFSYEKGSGYREKLVVTYTALTPEITVQPASNVATTTARLNATVVSDGADADNTSVQFGYGNTTQTAGNFLSYDNVTGWVWGYVTGNHPYLDVSDLVASTTYYFRAMVQNSADNHTSTSEITFTTESSISNVTEFYGIPSEDSLSISWDIPDGATYVLIRSRLDTYPTGVTDGDLVWFGGNTTFEYTGLLSGRTYFLSIWGEDAGSYSSSNGTLALTTLGVDPYGEGIGQRVLPTQWFNVPSSLGLANLDPIPTIVANFAGGWGMPADNMWFLLWMGIVVLGGGLAILLKWGKVSGSMVWVICSMVFGVAIGLVPAWMIMIPVLLALGGWGLSRLKPVGV